MVRSKTQSKTKTKTKTGRPRPAPAPPVVRDRNVKAFARRLQQKIELTRLIWFGSRVRDEHLLTSDYDFIIVSPSFAQMPFIERPVKLYALWTAKVGADFLCYTPEEFERKSREICVVQEAVRTGVQVYPA